MNSAGIQRWNCFKYRNLQHFSLEKENALCNEDTKDDKLSLLFTPMENFAFYFEKYEAELSTVLGILLYTAQSTYIFEK